MEIISQCLQKNNKIQVEIPSEKISPLNSINVTPYTSLPLCLDIICDCLKVPSVFATDTTTGMF